MLFTRRNVIEHECDRVLIDAKGGNILLEFKRKRNRKGI
jgi:hypothetical protein